MNEMNVPETERYDGQEIDLVELAKQLWGKRRFFMKCAGVALAVGLVVAFSLPKEYETTVKLAPEISDPSKRIGNLGGLAAMAGINIGASVGSDAISPDLYPDVVQSVPFLLDLFSVRVESEDGERASTLYEYMTDGQRRAWWSYVISIPFKLIEGVKNLFSEEEEEEVEPSAFRLSEEQSDVIEALQNRITAEVDKKTLVITVNVRMQDPLISADVTRTVLEKLQEYITDYRTRKVKQDLEFTQKVFGEARDSYYKAQRAYATFEDANKNIITASYRTELERLRNEMTLAFNVYNTLAQKQEEEKLRVQEQTPVYTVIQPATVPLKASSPRKLLILVGFVFLSLVGGAGYLYIKEMFAASAGERREEERTALPS